MIELKNLNKYFDKGSANEIHVINDVTLSLPASGMVAVFGKSGCGKTTLLNVIGGLDRFDGGSLTIDGQEIGIDTDTTRNSYIGYIFQNYNLHSGETCFSNVAAALRLCGMTDEEEIARRVRAALRQVDMEKYEKRTPDTLSGGQQQRVAIARAIVKNPRIILADEPTGNLDEANTVMIMDLLKRISRDHLVLLVTHEANLVDHYCDTVIELSDGAVVGMRQNSNANGYVARDKNAIYLGELQKTVFGGEGAEVEYYGELPQVPVRLKLVSLGGKLYCHFDTAGVQVLDGTGEMRLLEGVFTEEARAADGEKSIDMSELPPVSCTRPGRLFTFTSSLFSGFRANFRKNKKGKKLLVGCLCLFAAAIVMMSAVFGTVFASIGKIDRSYNHNVFYVYTADATVSARLCTANEAESGIDGLRLSSQYPDGDDFVWFYPGNFETFSTGNYISGYQTNAVYLGAELAAGKTVVAGVGEPQPNELLITTAVADALLENSPLAYVKKYEDLLGLYCSTFTVNGENLHIAGVVKSEEPAVYLNETDMARYVIDSMTGNVKLADDLGLTLAAGEAVVALNSSVLDYTQSTVVVNGRELRVKEVIRNYDSYPLWLTAKGMTRNTSDAYIEAIVKAENPTLDPTSAEFLEAKEAALTTYAYQYLAYYYAYFDEFLRDRYFFERGDLDLFILCEMGVEDMKYALINEGETLFLAEKYKALHGRYPTPAELVAAKPTLPDYVSMIKQYQIYYEEIFYQREPVYFPSGEAVYLLCDLDYIAASKQYGETTRVTLQTGDAVDGKEPIYEGGDVMVDSFGTQYFSYLYTVVHSSDPGKTAQWLAENFGDVQTGAEYLPAILTPNDVLDARMSDVAAGITASLIAMAVVLLLMSVCMYFIMRSSLMNRVKEIGIWRAIGVSRRNLTFRFFVEALVLTALTVFVGYLLTSGFLVACLSLSPLVEEIFFYPLPLALADLGVLFAVSLICGTLPILLLLKKTPAEILAKYDI